MENQNSSINMEELISELLHDIKGLKDQVEVLANEHNTRGYSVDDTAERLGVHYNTVRNLIKRGKLKVKYLDGNKGKCVVPAFAIEEYLKSANLPKGNL